MQSNESKFILCQGDGHFWERRETDDVKRPSCLVLNVQAGEAVLRSGAAVDGQVYVQECYVTPKN